MKAMARAKNYVKIKIKLHIYNSKINVVFLYL